MATVPKTICPGPGCRTIVPKGKRCARHAKRQESKPRPSAAKRGYGAKWRKLSHAFMAEKPLCAECSRHGRVTAAQCVDHIRPHEGDVGLLYDWDNLQSLCASCHSRKTRRESTRG